MHYLSCDCGVGKISFLNSGFGCFGPERCYNGVVFGLGGGSGGNREGQREI